MTKFMEFGFKIRAEDGIFDFNMDQRGPLVSCIFQVSQIYTSIEISNVLVKFSD